MKILVTGITGQLGFDVMREIELRNRTSIDNGGEALFEAVGATRKEMPLDAPDKIDSYIESVRPDAIINCAAYTAVDKAEDEPELAETINAKAPGVIARAAHDIGARLIHISTDYVFPGEGDDFYEVSDETGPRNAYGISKLDGERAVREATNRHFIVRISWVFGINGKNFIRTMLNLAKTHDSLTVVNDQIGSPTYTADLASLLIDMVQTEKYGTYHATNEGVCSWYDLACEVFRVRGLDVNVTPVPSSEYQTKATRPKNSRLSKKSLDDADFRRLPRWQYAVERYLEELKAIGE
ncbi:MAG: dTDP-4-dehydrorhamnose reductase [Schwartzia sp.]|nr:dTDP-4-dehydrorhamnose reductase [Schwartzia sp. (in: firmicutes)]